MEGESLRGGRRRFWALFLGSLALALALVAIPIFVIMPFKAQTAAGVQWSYWLRRASPWGTALCLLAALGACVRLWRNARWWGRAAMILLLVPGGLATWMARQNHFEWMFRPLPNAAYAPVREADFVADTDMVMAVSLNGDAVAFPVREMAYHHVVNDVVGGKPITATY